MAATARIDSLVEQLYDINKRLVGYEGRLMRLAESHAVSREDFLRNYQGSELDPRWLNRSRDLIEHAEVLYDEESEGYLDRLTSDDDPGRIAEQIVVLEDNALMARVLLDYAAYSGKMLYADRAQTMLRRFARDYQSQGLFAASYASAVLDIADPPIDVHVVASYDDPLARSLRAAALRVASPPLRVDTLDPQEQPDRAAVLGYSAAGVTAYLCRGVACFARITSEDELTAALADAHVRAHR